MPKILLATSLAESKAYCLPFLERAISRLNNVSEVLVTFDNNASFLGDIELPENWVKCELPLPKTLGRTSRIAAIRESQRKYALASDFDYLYWHDADMIPPPDILERLLSHDRGIASGIYTVRTYREPLASVMVKSPVAHGCEYLQNTGLLGRESKGEVIGIGMGCMLVRRDVLATSFRSPKWYVDGQSGEDYQFCIDAFARGHSRPLVDLSRTVWHVDEALVANRPNIGEPSACITYLGLMQEISNQWGIWRRGVPVWGQSIPREALHPDDFLYTESRKVVVESVSAEEALCL